MINNKSYWCHTDDKDTENTSTNSNIFDCVYNLIRHKSIQFPDA